MAVPKVIVIVPPGSDAPPLAAVEGEAEFVVVRTADELRAALPGVEILFLNHYRSELLREVGPGDLRWIHTSSIGVDALLTKEIIENDVVVTVSRGVCERPIAEWVLAVLLMFVKDLRRTLDLQRAAEWRHRETEPLEGRRVLLLGLGLVGRETAKLLRAAGMRVDIVASSAREDREVGVVHGIADLDRLLPTADDLVLALPLTDDTAGILDARRLGLLRRGARLVNVGRGPLVDEAVLLERLRDGYLDAAALDVFAEEPLPPEHPFWTMENVLVSPHMSGDLIGWRGRVVERFATNLRRRLAGEPLIDVVDLRQHAENAGSPATEPS
ncbi:MAG: D-2-hydroxyacid dehydrogenase [Actinobacteria bacterium]|nr:D-2-hydroxyacid dehydrogenase [Actinomycetota bacterium]